MHLFEYLIGGKKKPRKDKTFMDLEKGDSVWRWSNEHGRMEVSHCRVTGKCGLNSEHNFWVIPLVDDEGNKFSPGIELKVAEEKDVDVWSMDNTIRCYTLFDDMDRLRDELKKMGKL